MSAIGAVGRVDPGARRERLRALAVQQGLDAVLVTNLLNVRYLTGFTGSNGVLLLRADGADVLGTDGRYTTQAGTQAPDVELLIDRGTVSAVARAAVRSGAGRLGFEFGGLGVHTAPALDHLGEGRWSKRAPELRHLHCRV